ncbi:hypothetical protein IJU97_00810 [bacterium]|nr:hypothetical protein [bacterium]
MKPLKYQRRYLYLNYLYTNILSMENSRKSTIYSIIPLIILIVIIAFTRNGAKKGELQEAEKVFRINNYQNYEPSVQ